MEPQGRKRNLDSTSSVSDDYPLFKKARSLSQHSDFTDSEVSENELSSPTTVAAPYAAFLQNDGGQSATSSFGQANFTDSEVSENELSSPTTVAAPYAAFLQNDGGQSATSSFGQANLSDSDSSGDETSPQRNMAPYAVVQSQKDGDANYSEFAQRQMEKFGYKAGRGLGKFDQGRSGIVEASKQRGRRGLGFVVKGLDDEKIEWVEDEEIEMKEKIEWIPTCPLPPPQEDELGQWIKTGQKKLTIDDETEFCTPKVLQDILKCKTVFDALVGDEFLKARTRANPHEFIRGAIFQNRAAMKMANVDSAFDFMFTNPKNEQEQSLLGPNDLLYFADMCAGPGGFSEYVLWRRGWTAKGFGFTLKGNNDFKLEEFLAGSPETFEPLYGADGDGDIYKADNLVHFRRHVMDVTEGKGVHFAMADGGFSVEGQENIQEILSKQLYLCQFLGALSILRKGGCFMCKLFDLFTPFSIGLVYLLYRAFDKVCIFKPVTSRPANSERYVICKGLLEGAQDIHDHLFNANVKINRLKENHSSDDVMEVVPIQLIKDDKVFFDYMKESNDRLGTRQVRALLKLRAFIQDTTLMGPNQVDVRKQCLKLWKIPDTARAAARDRDADAKFDELWKGFDDEECFGHEVAPLNEDYLQELKSLYDYKCIVSGGERCFILGLGRSNVYQWDGKPNPRSNHRWKKVESFALELPKDTLIEVDIVNEMRGEGKGQRKSVAVHIIDAVWLGGRDVRDKHYQERMSLATVFVKAVSKPSRADLVPIRVKQTFRLENLDRIFSKLDHKLVKGQREPRECYLLQEGRHFIPRGIFFIKHIKDPWSQAYSRTHRRFYFYNVKTRESKFECPKESVASFKSCLTDRYFWSWETEKRRDSNHECGVEREIMMQFVLKKANQILHGK